MEGTESGINEGKGIFILNCYVIKSPIVNAWSECFVFLFSQRKKRLQLGKKRDELSQLPMSP